jgi:DNA-binding transcriptional ArsR family regulator
VGTIAAVHDNPVLAVPDDEHARVAADSFRMLSDPTRVKILWALLQGETSVSSLAELVDSSPTAVSQHLSKLRLAGLVDSRREGTFIYYSATDAHVHRLLAEALSHAEHKTGVATGDDLHTFRA